VLQNNSQRSLKKTDTKTKIPLHDCIGFFVTKRRQQALPSVVQMYPSAIQGHAPMTPPPSRETGVAQAQSALPLRLLSQKKVNEKAPVLCI